MKTTIKNKISLIAPAIAQHAHDRNYWDAVVWPDGEVEIVERANECNRTVINGDATRQVARLITVGTGSFACNCDACLGGAVGSERLGDDDVSTYEDLMIAALGEIPENYFV